MACPAGILLPMVCEADDGTWLWSPEVVMSSNILKCIFSRVLSHCLEQANEQTKSLEYLACSFALLLVSVLLLNSYCTLKLVGSITTDFFHLLTTLRCSFEKCLIVQNFNLYINDPSAWGVCSCLTALKYRAFFPAH